MCVRTHQISVSVYINEEQVGKADSTTEHVVPSRMANCAVRTYAAQISPVEPEVHKLVRPTGLLHQHEHKGGRGTSN